MKLIQSTTIGGAPVRLMEMDDGRFELSVEMMPCPLMWVYDQLDTAKKAYDTTCKQMMEHHETMKYILKKNTGPK